jgi:ABC-type amino acid transport system permease subunit
MLFAGIAWGCSEDCSPGQQDGQCGLATFVGLLNGLAAGGVFFAIASIVIGVDRLQENKRLEKMK